MCQSFARCSGNETFEKLKSWIIHVVTPTMTSAALVGFRFEGSKTMSQRVVVVVPRNHSCFPHDTILVHVLIVEHAPYLPYWLPPIQQLFDVSIYFDGFETIFLLAFRSSVRMLLNQLVPMNSSTYTRMNIKINWVSFRKLISIIHIIYQATQHYLLDFFLI